MDAYDTPPPATADDIAAWEAFAGAPMPADYKALLLSTNGPSFYDPPLRKELQFFAARDVQEMAEAYLFPEYLPDCAPICFDGRGNFSVFLIANGRVQGVYAVAAGNLFKDSLYEIGATITDMLTMDRSVEDCMI